MHTQPDDTAAPSVLLTGATGFVGRFLLSQLLNESDATIYCLVRARSDRTAMLRIRDTLTSYDLWRPGYERRVLTLPGDLRQLRLGLCRGAYETVVHEVGSIFHCGASVNHLETYEAAKAANVLATTELLKIAAQGRAKVLHHISTLGVFARNECAGTRVVSEDTPIEHERHRQSSGYAASKWVAESMVLKARSQGVPCNIYRLGLLWADSKQGRFDEQQHVYRLMQSCLLSGYGIENHHYEMDPVPVDYAVRAIVALAARKHGKRHVYHITSRVKETTGLFELCNQILDHPLKLMPLYEWVCEMRRLQRAGRTLPIVPLIEFAFSMGPREFAAHLQREESRRLRVDAELTARELEEHGIVPPRFSLDLVTACLEGMVRADQELLAPRVDGNEPRGRVGSVGARAYGAN